MTVGGYEIRIALSMQDFPKEEWNRLTVNNSTPFYDWEWLNLLEETGSVNPGTGWTPRHFGAWHNERLTAFLPLYEKTHSMGDFVYDMAWADVARQLDIDYYPKLVGTSPATPSGAYRIFHEEGHEAAADLLLDAVSSLNEKTGSGSLSFLFTDESFSEYLSGKGFHQWKHQRFSWKNRGYSSFEDYLGTFAKGQRRNIKKEVGCIDDAGVKIEQVWIEDTDADTRRFLLEMYEKTNDQFGPWAARFLAPGFFLKLNRIDKNRILLFLAKDRGTEEHIAVSMVAVKNGNMYGRYWGTRYFVKNLHFVLCYYEPIRYAIDNSYHFFDPGAGSPHKLRRGFEAVPVSSYHKFTSPVLDGLFAQYMPRINHEEEDYMQQMNETIPLRKHEKNLD